VGFGGAWTERAPIPGPARTWIRAATLGGKVYALGSADTPTLARLDVYDPATDTWSPATAPARAATPTTLTALGGKLYAIGTGSGGRQVQEYDPALDRWTVSDFSMPTGRTAAAAAAFGGSVYVFGGVPAGGGAALTTTEAFVPEP
jgi:N-acetylneuraminic acid mutarotase